MSSLRVWLFRVLVALGGVGMFYSAYQAWWFADIRSIMLEQSVEIVIYAWGFRPNVALLSVHLAGDFTPLIMSYLAWAYIGLSIGLALLSTWIVGRKGSWLLAAVGIVYVLYAVGAFIMIYTRTSQHFGINMLGYTILSEGGGIEVRARLETGYYLAYLTAFLFILLAAFRRAITGESAEPSTTTDSSRSNLATRVRHVFQKS